MSGVGFDELSDEATEVIDVFSGYMCKLLETETGKNWFESDAPSLDTEEFLLVVGNARKDTNSVLARFYS